MANKTIADLSAKTSLEGTDVLAVSNSTGTATNKVTYETLYSDVETHLSDQFGIPMFATMYMDYYMSYYGGWFCTTNEDGGFRQIQVNGTGAIHDADLAFARLSSEWTQGTNFQYPTGVAGGSITIRKYKTHYIAKANNSTQLQEYLDGLSSHLQNFGSSWVYLLKDYTNGQNPRKLYLPVNHNYTSGYLNGQIGYTYRDIAEMNGESVTTSACTVVPMYQYMYLF